jgi:hypothetical protein
MASADARAAQAVDAHQTQDRRPKIGKGAKIVPISIERGLLEEVNSYPKKHKLKRSQMVAEGLRLVMKKAG